MTTNPSDYRFNFNAIRRALGAPRFKSNRYTLYYIDDEPSSITGELCVIRRSKLIELYKKALDYAYDRLTQPPIQMETPKTPPVIYLFNLRAWELRSYPCTIVTEDVCQVALPSRTFLASDRAENEFDVAAAVHEMCHAICFSQKHSSRCSGKPNWTWFYEGTSVWFETLLWDREAAKRAGLPVSRDGLHYASDWCERTDRPLDSLEASYQAFPFVSYLVVRFGQTLVGEIWREANPLVDPWDIITRRTSLSADNLFHDFCIQAYVLNDANSPCHLPLVHKRFRGRAPTARIRLQQGQSEFIEGTVRGLSCRYYCVILHDAIKQVTCELEGADITGSAGFATASLEASGNPVPLGATTIVPAVQARSPGHLFLTITGSAALNRNVVSELQEIVKIAPGKTSFTIRLSAE